MKNRTTQTFELRPDQLAYLERMTEAHSLPDVSKTLRVLVSHAMAKPDLETEIFEVIRCASPEVCDSAPEQAEG